MEVRDVIKQLEQDGWRIARSEGSQRQYHHPAKAGTVTVAGHPPVDIPPGTLNNILQPGRSQLKYLVVYEQAATSWGAYVPDLPGLGVAATTLDEVRDLIREAIEFHVEGMREHGDPIPAPAAMTEYIRV